MKKQLNLYGEVVKRNLQHHEAKSYTGIYAMHKYWSKKPSNVIRTLILKYSKEEDVVLDPFCGSGVSIAEAILMGRKAMGIDINPSAIFITRQLLEKVSTKKMERTFHDLSKDLKGGINSLYMVKRGGKKHVGTHYIWNEGELKEVWYKDAVSRRKLVDQPLKSDLKLARRFSHDQIDTEYPEVNFFENSRINASRDRGVKDLFTPRNLKALSWLMERIEGIQDDSMRNTFKFCFTGAIGQASNMVFVVRKRGKHNSCKKSDRTEVGSWVIGYWQPEEYFEINAWNCFKNRYGRVLRAKKELKKLDFELKEANNVEDLFNSRNLFLKNAPSQVALKSLPEDSVDYVITDPPHGDRIPFLELSMLWNSWLKFDVNYDDEIVISNSRDRNKDLEDYRELMAKVFKQVKRVLKPDHVFTLIFNSLDDETWVYLLKSLYGMGFELKSLETMGYSANSVVQDSRKKGLKTDFILNFVNSGENSIAFKVISVKEKREQYVTKISRYIQAERKGKRLIHEILNFVVLDSMSKNAFPKLSSILKLLTQEFKILRDGWVKKKG